MIGRTLRGTYYKSMVPACVTLFHMVAEEPNGTIFFNSYLLRIHYITRFYQLKCP